MATERNISAGVWDGKTTKTLRHGRLYTRQELEAELLAKYKELSSGKGLARSTSQAFRLARQQAGTRAHQYIGTEDLLVGLLKLPRESEPALDAFFDKYLPGIQDEQVRTAITYLTDLDKGRLEALGKSVGIPETEEGGFRVGEDTEHAFRIATAEATAERRKLQPVDILVGIAPVRFALGPVMLMDMMHKDKVDYPALFQAYWYSLTEEEITFHMNRMIAKAQVKGAIYDYDYLQSPMARQYISWSQAHALLDPVRASGQEFNWQYEQAARQFGISNATRDLLLVRSCIGLYNRIKQVYLDVGEVGHQYANSKWHFALGPLPESMLETFEVAELLADVLEHAFRDGLLGQSTEPNLVQSQVNKFLDKYGLQVVERRGSKTTPES